jgi:hypothetical protein
MNFEFSKLELVDLFIDDEDCETLTKNKNLKELNVSCNLNITYAGF